MKFILTERFILTEATIKQDSKEFKKDLQEIIGYLRKIKETSLGFETATNEVAAAKAKIQTFDSQAVIKSTVLAFVDTELPKMLPGDAGISAIPGADVIINNIKSTCAKDTGEHEENVRETAKLKSTLVKQLNQLWKAVGKAGANEAKSSKLIDSIISSLQDYANKEFITENSSQDEQHAFTELVQDCRNTVPVVKRAASSPLNADQIEDLLNELKTKLIDVCESVLKDARVANKAQNIIDGEDWTNRYKRIMQFPPRAPETKAQIQAFWADYYGKVWPGYDTKFFDNLGRSWVMELSSLGFTEKENAFIAFIKHSSENIRSKLNANTYGAVHNAYVAGDIGNNDLKIDVPANAEKSALTVAELFTKQASEIRKYLRAGGNLQRAKIIDENGKLKPVNAIDANIKKDLSDDDPTVDNIFSRIDMPDKKEKILYYLISTYASESDFDTLMQKYGVPSSLDIRGNQLQKLAKYLSPGAVNVSDLEKLLATIKAK